MADHLRKQIREAAVTLVTGLTTTGSNVFESRSLALTGDQLPAWVVRTENEDHPDDERTMDATIRRELELSFEGYAKATTGISLVDTLELMLQELEVQFETDRKLGGLLKESRLMTIEIDDESEADQVIGGVRVVYILTYWTTRGVPDVAL